MHPRSPHPLLALTLVLFLTLAQLAVAAHGVVHPLEDASHSNSPACQHLVGHGLGSALPGSNAVHFGSQPSFLVAAPPLLPSFGGVTCRYQARAPPA